MKIQIKRIDQDFGMAAVNETGNTVVMDASTEFGGHGHGMRPMELVISALGGCSAIDIIHILKKQKQVIESFNVEIEAKRVKTEDYSLFEQINLHFKIMGKIDADKAQRAADLSIEKYCSVAKILQPTAQINYKISIEQ